MPEHQGTSYRIVGQLDRQPVLVLIHGVGLNQDLWLPWLKTFEDKYCVVTFDLYGHGGSINPPGDRSARDFVEQLHQLMQYLQVSSFSLAGFSLGALISQAYSSLYPKTLNHLILLHSVYKRTEEQCKSVRERYGITKEKGVMATVELAIQRWFNPEFSRDNPEEMQWLRDVFSKHTDDGYLKAYYLFGNAEPEMKGYALQHVKCPALVVTGEDDVGSIPAMSEALAKDLPNAQLIVNPRHRHGAPTEFAAEMASQVLSFLQKTTLQKST